MAGFKEFVLRGNVIDLAVGVIIGVAFGDVVTSVTKDVITPIIGMAGGVPDFAALKVGPIGVGSLINAVVGFLITAFVVYFAIVKPVSAMMERLNPPPKPGDPPPPPPDIVLLREIRDLLKSRSAASN